MGTPDTPTTNEAPGGAPAHRRRRLVGGLVVATALVATGATIAVGADRDPASAVPTAPMLQVAEVVPAHPHSHAGGHRDEASTNEPTDTTEPTDDDRTDDWDDSDWDDPFAGMTDAEIDALTDDEYEQLLDDAGWTDDDWDDPVAGMTDAEIDALTDDEYEQLLDDAGWTDDDWHDDDWDDPFAGMTDAEIDALTDDEYEQLLDDAGWTDDDWDDPVAGMTDAEIDALTDDEYEQLLDDAGWTDDWTDGDWDDSDWDDPFAGMTDAEIDALTDDEYEQLLDDAGWTDDWDDGDWDEFDEVAPIGTFEVDGDRIDTSNADADAAATAERIWARFVELIPADQRSMLVRFELLSPEEGGHVYPDDDPTRWVMGIGSDLGNEEDDVLIHEFAHLLTLQAGEVPPGDDDGTCPTYHTGEGCALSGSTFAGFVARFWSDDLLERLDDDGPEAVYDADPSRFVTDYAATNPAEDLAEVFTAFVLKDRPTGDTIADDKVRFLWDDPAMVALRDHIRARL